VIFSTSHRLKVVWPRSLRSTHSAEERGTSVFDPRAEVSGLRTEVSNWVSENPDLFVEVFNLGGAFRDLYWVLMLFPRKERIAKTISRSDAIPCMKCSPYREHIANWVSIEPSTSVDFCQSSTEVWWTEDVGSIRCNEAY